MVKVHSAREETRCRHYMGYSFCVRILLYAPSHRQDNNTTAFITPIMDNWLEGEIAQWVNHEGSIRQPITYCADALSRAM